MGAATVAAAAAATMIASKTTRAADEYVFRGGAARIAAGALEVAYYQLGDPDAIPVLLLHGWPYDIHSYVEVAPLLAERGCRVIVPYLRGHGPTRFRDPGSARSGQQAAIGSDVIALLDALKIERAILAGYDWGGRAACVAAALWPQRCAGLVSVNGYLIQDIARASQPLSPRVESAFWYQFYFLTERGRAGLAQNRREIARLMWARNSPSWRFDDAAFDRSAASFENPDYVDVVIHSYRHRLGHAQGFPEYAAIEAHLAAQPPIAVPAITLDGAEDGVVPATDGRALRERFIGDHEHRVIRGAGHNLPQEAPQDFADAILTLVRRARTA
jgi:pimeloyl-ACP methyl ester carboxylesterase